MIVRNKSGASCILNASKFNPKGLKGTRGHRGWGRDSEREGGEDG